MSNEIPPVISATPEDPADRLPVDGIISAFEALLRQPRRVVFHLRGQNPAPVLAALAVITVLCALIYGFVVGTFSGGTQLWAAPVKIAGGLLIAGLICLPSLYIFACLGGSRARLVEVAGSVAGLLALMTVLLIGFAPVAWIFSQSTESIVAMGALHLAFWFVSTYFGLKFLNRAFDTLDGRVSGGLKVWIVIFLLVIVQMTTALRPIIGTAPTFLPTEKKFFLSHWSDCVREGSSSSGTR